MDVSVIIINWNTRELLRQCLQSLRSSLGDDLVYETIVVDNASSDGSTDMVVRDFPSVHLIRNASNLGFAAANNQALQQAGGRHVLLLNSDTIVLPAGIQQLVQFLDVHPTAGIAGPRLLNGDGTLQASWAEFPTLVSELLGKNFRVRRDYAARNATRAYAVDSVGGACLLIRGEALREIGPLDDRYFMYCEEIDWCYRVRSRGWDVCYLPDAQIIHLGGQSSMQAAAPMKAQLYRSKLRFFRKHYGSGAALSLAVCLEAKFLLKAALGFVLRLLRLEPAPRRGATLRDGLMLSKAVAAWLREQWRQEPGRLATSSPQ